MVRRSALSPAHAFVIAVVVVLVVAGAFAAYSYKSSPSVVNVTTSTSQTGSFMPPNCTQPCAVWTKPGGSNPSAIAVSPDDSFVAVGNGSGIYLLDDHGNTLWTHDLDHTVSSISISSDGRYIAAGGWQTLPGPAGIYANGEIYLFDSSSGKLLWSMSTGSSDPVWKVAISADGSAMAVEGESSVMYIDTATQGVVWSESTGGNFGMAMSANGDLVVASGPSSIMAFNAQGAILWSSPLVGIGDNNVAISSNASYVWVGEAVSGYNGTLSLFTAQGALLWQRQIYSPSLSIQTGDNVTAFVSTNWGALLYGSDGSLLKNVTSPAPIVSTGGCSPLPSFWYWGGNESPVSFFDSQGTTVSSYTPGGYMANAALSPDRNYAAIVSNEGSNSSYLLTFVFLGQLETFNSSGSCLHD